MWKRVLGRTRNLNLEEGATAASYKTDKIRLTQPQERVPQMHFRSVREGPDTYAPTAKTLRHSTCSGFFSCIIESQILVYILACIINF